MHTEHLFLEVDMGWDNILDFPYEHNMASPEGCTLTVDGLTTCNGNLAVPGVVTVADSLVLFSPAAGEYCLRVAEVGGELFVGGSDEEGDLHLSKPDGLGTNADVIVESPRFRVGPDVAAGGFIDASGNGVDTGRPLQIGTTQFRTSSVVIGRNDLSVIVHAPLLVGDGAAVIGLIDADWDGAAARPLGIGTQASTANVTIGRNGIVVGIADDLNVGDDLSVGGALAVTGAITGASLTIPDADVNGTALKVTNSFDNINAAAILAVGRVNITANTTVAGGSYGLILQNNHANAASRSLVVSGAKADFGVDVDLHGELRLGPANNPGLINSGGSAETPRNLIIGGLNVTDDVLIGNGDGVVDIMQTGRMNSFGLVLDESANVVAGTGIIYSAAGHANPAIEFWTDGNLAGWMDVNGWHAGP